MAYLELTHDSTECSLLMLYYKHEITENMNTKKCFSDCVSVGLC